MYILLMKALVYHKNKQRITEIGNIQAKDVLTFGISPLLLVGCVRTQYMEENDGKKWVSLRAVDTLRRQGEKRRAGA